MTEAMVEDSLTIPKVSAKKDFKDYFKSLEKSEISIYEKNNEQLKDNKENTSDNPFKVADGVSAK